MNEANTLEGKALLRLFQLYWRRTVVWDDCIRQVQFAPFVSALRQRFDKLLVDPKRVRTAFSLQDWDSIIDQEQFDYWYYPAGVTVWQTGETFTLTTYAQLSDVRAEKRDALVEVAEELRRVNGVKTALRDEQSYVLLRRRKDLTQEKAIEETVSQMLQLQSHLGTIC
ncbi:hypothetical protein MJS38_32810, partial [Burkholderia gladioli]